MASTSILEMNSTPHSSARACAILVSSEMLAATMSSGSDWPRSRMVSKRPGSRSAGTTPRRTRTSPRYCCGAALIALLHPIDAARRRRRAGVVPVPATAGLDGAGRDGGGDGQLFARHPSAATSAQARHRDRLARSVLLHRLGRAIRLQPRLVLLLDHRLADVLHEAVGAAEIVRG